MKKAEITKQLKDFIVHNPLIYTDKENLKWCWLRAVECGQWPLFAAQLIAPVLLLFFQWWQIAVAVVILTWVWALIRYKYVNIILAGLGPLVIIVKWPVSIGMGIYFIIKADYILVAIAVLWPLITLLLMWLTPSTKIGVIQTALMNKLGYDKII